MMQMQASQMDSHQHQPQMLEYNILSTIIKTLSSTSLRSWTGAVRNSQKKLYEKVFIRFVLSTGWNFFQLVVFAIMRMMW